MAIFKHIVFLFGIYILSLDIAHSQNNFIIKQYNSTNGLPQNSINGLQMDENDFMWLATEGGIVRFDGTNFKVYKEYDEGKPITSDRIKGILKTVSNQLIAYDIFGRAYQIKNNQLHLLLKTSPTIYLQGVLPSVQSYSHINKVVSKNWKNWQGYVYPLSIYPLDSTKYILRSKEGFYIFKDTSLEAIIAVNNLITTHSFVLNKKVYFFDKDKNLYVIDENKKTFNKANTEGEMFSNPVYKASKVNNRILWNYSSNQAYTTIGQSLYQLIQTKDNGILSRLVIDKLPKNCIINSALYNNINQSYYIGTDTKGLFVFKQKEITTLIYNKKNESVSNSYYAQIPIDKQSVLTFNGLKFNMRGAEEFPLGIKSANSEGLLKSKNGMLWYGIGSSIFKYDFITKKHTLICDSTLGRVTTFYELNDTIWVGTPRSIGYIINDKYSQIIKDFKKPDENSTPFCIIKNNNKLWIATCGGIVILDVYSKKIVPHIALENYCVRAFFQYKDIILIGTYGTGYFVYKNRKFTQMPMDENNCLKSVHGFLLDDSNYVWMSTNRGLFKLYINELYTYIADTTKKVFYSYFDQADGLENIEFNGGCTPNCVKLDNGMFSFSSMEGLVWFNPFKIKDPIPNSKIFIDEILVDKTVLNADKNIILPSDFIKIIFSISSSYWGNNANLNYEYNLEGLNENWLTLKNNNLNIIFPNLPSGNYTLHIRKKAGFGSNNYIKKYISFSVEKRLYEEMWFIFIFIILILILIISIVRVFSYNIRKRNMQLEKIIQSRIGELVDLNKELSASEKKLKQSVDIKNMLISIISHDIVTPLRFISITAKNAFKGNNMLNMDFIKDIQTTSDKLHQNAQNMLNWIRYQNDLIKVSKEAVAAYTLIEEQLELVTEMTLQKKNTFVNEISYDDIIYTDSTILNIIVQNVISNANKYCQNATVTITGEMIEDKYHLAIEDNGPGISKENLLRIKEIKAQRSVEIISNKSGIGYVIIVELLELLKSKIKIESTEGVGTKITLIL